MSPWALVSHFSTEWNFFSKSFYFSRMRKHPDIKQHWCSMSMTLRRNSDLKCVNAFGIFQNREHFRLHLLPELSNSCYTFSINWCEYCKYFLEHLSILSSNLWAYLNIYLDILRVNLPRKKQFWPKKTSVVKIHFNQCEYFKSCLNSKQLSLHRWKIKMWNEAFRCVKFLILFGSFDDNSTEGKI